MSYDKCKYCDEIAYKTNGDAESICFNRAHTGKCEGEKTLEDIKAISRNKPCPCGSGKNYKNCHGKK